MSPANKDHLISSKITDEIIAKHIAEALRSEHYNITPAIAQIEKVTGIKSITARKWYNGKYAPKSKNLLILSMHYPQVLRALLELIGIGVIWQEMVRKGIIQNMQKRLDDKLLKWKKSPIIEDKFVLIRVRVHARNAVQFNQRQLWFLGEMQQGHNMHATNIVDIWHVHRKTAGRDVKGLLEAGLIVAIKTGRKYRYELMT